MLIGIAADRTEVTDHLREVLSDRLVDHEGNLNYILSLASEPRRFHQLRWGGCTAVRSLDAGRVIRGLGRHLVGHAPAPIGSIVVDAVASVRDGEAWLLPPTLRTDLTRRIRPLRHAGFELTDAPWATIDLVTGELVVRSDALLEELLMELTSLSPDAPAPDPGVEAGRYRLAGVAFTDGAGADEMPAGDATTRLLAGLPVGAARWTPLVDALHELLSGIRRPVIQADTPAGFARALSVTEGLVPDGDC